MRINNQITGKIIRRGFLALSLVTLILAGLPLAAIFRQPVQIVGAKLTVGQKIYRADQKPAFNLQYQAKAGGASFGLVYAAQLPKTQVLYNGGSLNIPVHYTNGPDGMDLSLAPTGQIQPGEYTLKVYINTAKGQQTVQQNFAWGVLALNFNKAVYHPGETADIQMGVLDSSGHTICNAPLSVTIMAPDGGLSRPPVGASGQCNGDNYVNVPDYHSSYQTGPLGRYKVVLKLASSNYTMTDYFSVSNNIPFDVSRSGPSRVFPPKTYPMTMLVTPAHDFTGTVTEKLPAGFSAQPGQGGQLAKDNSKITWQVNWQAGRQYNLSYNFRAPDVSPAFYFMGPLSFNNAAGQQIYKEPRQWQLAGDTVADTADFEKGSNNVQIKNTDAGSDTPWDQVSGDCVSSTGCSEYNNSHFYGTMAAEFNTTSAGDGAFTYWQPSSATNFYGRAYFYIPSAPTQSITLLGFALSSAGQTDNSITLRSTDGTLGVGTNGGSSGHTTATVALGQWIRIEYHLVNSTSSGSFDVKLFNNADSTTQTDEVNINAAGTNTNTSTKMIGSGIVGWSTGALPANYAIWADNIETLASNWIGPQPDCLPQQPAALVQSTSGALTSTTGSPYPTLTWANATKKNDLLVAIVGAADTAAHIVLGETMVDSTWTAVAQVNSGSSTASGLVMFYKITSGGETSESFDVSSTGTSGTSGKKLRIAIFEYSGVDNVHPFDLATTSQNTNTASCPTACNITTGSVTPSNANSLIIAGVHAIAASTNVFQNTWTNGFTRREHDIDNRLTTADLILNNASGTYSTNETWSQPGTSDSVIGVFKIGTAYTGTQDLMSGGDYFCNETEQGMFWAR